MGIGKSLIGLLDVHLTSASITGLLTDINNAGIHLLCVKSVDELSVHATIYRYDYRLLCSICRKKGGECRITTRHGIYWALKSLVYRPVLIIGMSMLLLLALVLPSRILFVWIEGNESIPTNLIIEKAETCGICFGSERALVRSENIKNKLLSLIPQLQWAGINTYGCVAVISVQERQAADALPSQTETVNSIVAIRDGVIEEMTVFNGNPLCKPGQAVEKGQILVSGYIDCGLLIKAVRANAEIKAKTHRGLEVISPLPSFKRAECFGVKRNFSLIIGKKLINLYKGSGISDAGCVKICTQRNLKLPGGFLLPIALVEERIERYEEVTAVPDNSTYRAWLTDYAENYLCNQMLAGQVLSRQLLFDKQTDAVLLKGTYECLEIIGKIQSEENLQIHGKSD